MFQILSTQILKLINIVFEDFRLTFELFMFQFKCRSENYTWIKIIISTTVKVYK